MGEVGSHQPILREARTDSSYQSHVMCLSLDRRLCVKERWKTHSPREPIWRARPLTFVNHILSLENIILRNLNATRAPVYLMLQRIDIEECSYHNMIVDGH
jgi:hypothetical protein